MILTRFKYDGLYSGSLYQLTPFEQFLVLQKILIFLISSYFFYFLSICVSGYVLMLSFEIKVLIFSYTLFLIRIHGAKSVYGRFIQYKSIDILYKKGDRLPYS